MKKIILPLITVLLTPTLCGAIENLDEMMARRDRQATAAWGYQYLEDPNNNYTWQPETLMYTDDTTGHEVWVLVRQPHGQDIYSKEFATNCWSFDGSRVGFFDYSTRDTATPGEAAGNDRGSRRWVVNTDGSGLRPVEGFGKYDIPHDGYSWANTELAYYAFGSHATIDGPLPNLYKVTLDHNNKATGSLLIDTAPINSYAKQLVKSGITADDSWIVARDLVAHDAGTCNVRTTSELYFIHLDGSPAIDYHWGIARGIGPAGDPYGTHIPLAEERFHDVFAVGSDPEYIYGDFSGESDIWVAMKRSGSCSDGGPLWVDWDGDSFGPNDEIKVVSNGTGGSPVNPYNMPYIGHPSFDRWGKYGLIGTYTDYPKPGTRIWDLSSNTLLPNYVLAYGKYDGQHHSWSGWSDYILAVEPDWPIGSPTAYFINANKWNQEYTEAFAVVNTNFPGYAGNYNGYPRPSQSPDGTKVAFSTVWLNNEVDKYPYISWAVVHYPHPPKIISAAQADTAVRITWGWDAGNLYTTRGWPDEVNDSPPLPREIKAYHVWTSTDLADWTELTTTGVPYGTNFFDANQPPGTTRFYAVTSEEHSRLESRTLSNIWQITVDGAGVITQSAEASPYPSTPGGVTQFWHKKPDAPWLVTVTPQSTTGHVLLKWEEPADSKIRYYNIYYSTTESLTPDMLTEKTKIASVPVGTSQWLDWNAEPNASRISYRITSVDRQGNEGVLPPPR